MSVIGAVTVAAVAASLIGTAGVAQRRGSISVPPFPAGDPRLIGALARSQWWWIGTGVSLAGIALQILALALGSILLVQSVMTTSIVGATLAERFLLHRRTSGETCAGIVLTVAGLSGLLLALDPHAGGAPGPSALTTVGLAAAAIAVMVTIAGWARRRALGPRARALGLAFGTGLGYGLSAVQLKQVGAQVANGIATPLGHPAIYAAVVLGSLAILLSQHALREGVGVAAVVSVILVVDPVVGLVAGGLWFGDAVTTSPVALVLATVCAAVLLVGMVATQSSSDRSAPGAGPHGADIDGERPVTAQPEPGGSRDTPAHAREQVVSATAQGPGTTRLS
ncbi:DMT family transporter [Pseudonocardia dioxanivorans]|uniref:DMT family transporter n=1 Tax=Pseudonocardia dioxanivorans TaxID=240495 RepID=UPI00104FA5AF|nr:DMT family transporter [Pseudonocardia dioxanivorans]